jgi:uncharacterized RDD family membrane protein YckC
MYPQGGTAPVGPPQPPGWQQGPPPPRWSPAPHPGQSFGPLASFGVRFAAWLLDSLLYGLVAAVFVIPGVILIVAAFDDCVTFNDELFCPPGAPEPGLIAAGAALIVVGVVLTVVLFVRAMGRTGQTWGARIVDVKVIDGATGQPLGSGRALGRQLFAWFISAQVLYLGYLWAAWDSETQTWQDKIVKSIVVRTNQPVAQQVPPLTGAQPTR